jgi:hypothetical protein
MSDFLRFLGLLVAGFLSVGAAVITIWFCGYIATLYVIGYKAPDKFSLTKHKRHTTVAAFAIAGVLIPLIVGGYLFRATRDGLPHTYAELAQFLRVAPILGVLAIVVAAWTTHRDDPGLPDNLPNDVFDDGFARRRNDLLLDSIFRYIGSIGWAASAICAVFVAFNEQTIPRKVSAGVIWSALLAETAFVTVLAVLLWIRRNTGPHWSIVFTYRRSYVNLGSTRRRHRDYSMTFGARWRTVGHQDGFQIAKQLERYGFAVERRLEADDDLKVRTTCNKLAASLRRAGVRTADGPDARRRFDTLVLASLVLIIADNPVAAADRVAHLLVHESVSERRQPSRLVERMEKLSAFVQNHAPSVNYLVIFVVILALLIAGRLWQVVDVVVK